MASRGTESPRLQPFVGWFLLFLGAGGLSYGGWRLLNAISTHGVASPTAVATSDSGVVWAVVLFFLLPGAVFAYAGVVLLVRNSGERDF